MSQKSQCHYKPVLEVSTTARNTPRLLLLAVIPITTETGDQTPAATDLLKPTNEAHIRELLQKGPNQ